MLKICRSALPFFQTEIAQEVTEELVEAKFPLKMCKKTSPIKILAIEDSAELTRQLAEGSKDSATSASASAASSSPDFLLCDKAAATEVNTLAIPIDLYDLADETSHQNVGSPGPTGSSLETGSSVEAMPGLKASAVVSGPAEDAESVNTEVANVMVCDPSAAGGISQPGSPSSTDSKGVFSRAATPALTALNRPLSPEEENEIKVVEAFVEALLVQLENFNLNIFVNCVNSHIKASDLALLACHRSIKVRCSVIKVGRKCKKFIIYCTVFIDVSHFFHALAFCRFRMTK